MTDLDTLRRALRASPERGPAPVFDPAEIIASGRRLRWRRRAAAAGGGLCLAAAAFGAVVGVGRLAAPSPGPAHHVVTPVGPAGTIGPAGTRPRPVPSPRRNGATPVQRPTASASAAQPATPATSATTMPTPTRASPMTSQNAEPSNAPTPTTSPGAMAPSATPSSGDSGGTTPTASASGASADQPSPTRTATQ